ncbi:MAG: DUF3820 family protein [Verrucomicrobium sp.]|nr:DUF3820 family protein [Verrucomicrobium sp.]
MSPEELAARMASDMADIEKMNMPFGKFGPQFCPPHGVPIFDLPAEYLGWFAKKGFPKGKLGHLLQIVHQMKADGSDAAFDGMRRRRGGRTPLREERPREWNVGESNPF